LSLDSFAALLQNQKTTRYAGAKKERYTKNHLKKEYNIDVQAILYTE
jgi:hypothetical protein